MERVATEPRPVWLPLNYLPIEALERYHHFYGDAFTMEFPTGSGRRLNLAQIAEELSRRFGDLVFAERRWTKAGAGHGGAVCRRPALAGADVVP